MGSRGRSRLPGRPAEPRDGVRPGRPSAESGPGGSGGSSVSGRSDRSGGTRTSGGRRGSAAGGGATGGPAAPDAPAVPVRGRAERRRTARRAARRRRRSLLREIPLIAVVALLVALVMKTFLVQVFVIPSGSMEQTIQVGDRVLVDKLTPWFGSEPKRGDVVVFKDPGGWLEAEHKASTDGPLVHGAKQVLTFVGLLPSDSKQDLIKRVIGVGGDTVECCDGRGRVSINGTAVDEPYLFAGNAPSRQPFKVQVPQGRLWVMGDHREVSADSRFHTGGPGQGTIPLSGVVGRAFLIGWPLERIHQLDAPSSLSSVARGLVGRGTGPDSMDIGPTPKEPPLVMGVLGILPLVVRRPVSRPR
ncbi:signal peptidase I [Kitasatospora sp. NPDC054939]